MKLSLRDLFWLVALVAMGCGWWEDRTRLASKENTEIRFRAHQRQAWEALLRSMGR